MPAAVEDKPKLYPRSHTILEPLKLFMQNSVNGARYVNHIITDYAFVEVNTTHWTREFQKRLKALGRNVRLITAHEKQLVKQTKAIV